MNSSCTRLFLEPLKSFLFSQPQKAIYLHILIFCLSINSIMFQVILLSMKPSNTWEVIGCIMNTNYKHSLKYIEYSIVSSNIPMHQSPTSL